MKKNFAGILLLLLVLLLVACGGGNDDAVPASGDSGSVATAVATGDPVAGEAKYNEVCIACHGLDGVGVENLGKPFTTSEFVKGKTDAELLAFVKVGRPIGDPDNTTGIDMPPKGGNPALNDEQLMDIIAYLRTLQQ